MYICLEGIDGSGKSTQITLLEKWLNDIGQEVLQVREPTQSDVGVLLRKMLASSQATEENVQRTLALLFAADRTVLMKEIEEAKSAGKVVISDRCFYSSMVYQNDVEWISQINKYAKRPDITILLDLETETALKRCEGKDHFENIDFLKDVRDKYLELAEKEDFYVINAGNGVNKVHDDIKRVLSPKFGVCI
ncbi:MAG: dTMP kinase [Methanobacteriaceae archaeon]|jgi:dTMP kinase|nr:dTMP kinase [Methanobacteriaceae archaeon]OPY24196.1 MAG: putative thymidylate kinase [Methanobacterium sp. PtaU1.Bin097]